MRNVLFVRNIESEREVARLRVITYGSGSVTAISRDVVDHFGQLVARLGGQDGGAGFEQLLDENGRTAFCEILLGLIVSDRIADRTILLAHLRCSR